MFISHVQISLGKVENNNNKLLAYEMKIINPTFFGNEICCCYSLWAKNLNDFTNSM